MFQVLRQFAVCFFAVAACFHVVAPDVSAAPKIQSLSVRGLQIGGTTTIRVTGTDLLPNPQLLMSVPIAKQTIKPNATATRVEFDVTLDASVAAGIYNFWVASDSGVSPAAFVAADKLPNTVFGPEARSLPVSLHGVVSGSAKLRTTFSAAKDQPVLLEVESQRLGGKLRPVLHIYDSSGKHLKWSLPSPVLRGDTRLQFKPPADGKYTVELHDLQYAAPAPNFFRLKIGSWQYADLAFPPAIERSKPTPVELIGNFAAGSKVNLVSGDSTVAPPAMTNAETTGAFRPAVLISELPEVVETSSAETLQQLPAVPFGISGRLLSEGEQDRYKLTVVSGAKLRFEVFADRLGAPMDAVLQILNEQGGQLAMNDDVAGSPDPKLDYVIPAKTTTIVLAVKEANGIGSPNNVYRVHVSDVSKATPDGDFKLNVAQQEQSVTAGERLVVKVTAERDGFTGPIRLEFDSLPAGVQVQGAMIAAEADSTLMTLHGSGLATRHALTSLRGVAEISDREVVRYVTGTSHLLGKMQPWLGREFALALTAPSPIDFDFNWGRIDANTRLVLGGKLEVPLQYFRPAGFDGPIRVTAEFSQKPVLANGKVDANRTMRSETNRPVEMAIDQNAQKAWDARLALAKVLAAERTRLTVATQSAVKGTADSLVQLKKTKNQLAAAQADLKLAETQARAKNDAAIVTAAALAKAITRVQSVTKAAEVTTDIALSRAAEGIAATAAELQSAATAKAAAQKAATVATMAMREAASVVAAAQAAVAQADAAVKVAIAVEAKAKTDARTGAVESSKKQLAAATAAENAARLAVNKGVFAIFVPADLKDSGYDVAFKAELLSRDKKTVLTTRYSEVRRLQTLNPIVLQSTTADKIVAAIGAKAGATVSISGKVSRLGGMRQSVTVSLVGLPTGIAVPKATVKASQTDYKLDVKFPTTFKPAELTGIRVFATGKMRANAPIAVRSEELPVTIQLTSPPMPAEKK